MNTPQTRSSQQQGGRRSGDERCKRTNSCENDQSFNSFEDTKLNWNKSRFCLWTKGRAIDHDCAHSLRESFCNCVILPIDITSPQNLLSNVCWVHTHKTSIKFQLSMKIYHWLETKLWVGHNMVFYGSFCVKHSSQTICPLLLTLFHSSLLVYFGFLFF